MPRTSVIIPTYNRPEELEDCLRSLARQTVPPDELLVVDDGNLSRIPAGDLCRQAGVECRHIHKKEPGLTESRNVGVERSGGEIVFFFDDDVVLFPDYIEKVLALYAEDDSGDLGGVGGFIVNTKPLTLPRALRYAFDVPFLVSGLREGRVLKSGFCTDFGDTPFPLRRVTPVEFLPGAAFSFRRQVLEEFSFTPGFRDVALGEDKDFTVRVSRRYRLLLHPGARLYHFESPRMRPAKRPWGCKFLTGRYLLFRDQVSESPIDRIFFFYAALGYLLARTAVLLSSMRREELDHLLGACDALHAIIAGDINFET